MGEQCRSEVSSLVHPDPGATSRDAGSPVDEDAAKSIVTVESCSPALEAQCREFESQTGTSEAASASNYDLLYETIQSLQRLDCDKPKRKRGSKNNHKPGGSCNRKCSENFSVGRQGCYYVASFAADCVAICCCPCAILHIFVLAFVKVPSVYARKAFCYAKRKARSIHGKKDRSKNNNKQEEEEENADDDDDGKGRSSWCYTPPWSPQPCGPPPDGSCSLKFDTEKLWSELYAAGSMGFGGLSFEKN